MHLHDSQCTCLPAPAGLLTLPAAPLLFSSVLASLLCLRFMVTACMDIECSSLVAHTRQSSATLHACLSAAACKLRCVTITSTVQQMCNQDFAFRSSSSTGDRLQVVA